tara:strand:+ start:853 stop:1731 length:879 start_codon:yes stop_codon:yes gene_type:complete
MHPVLILALLLFGGALLMLGLQVREYLSSRHVLQRLASGAGHAAVRRKGINSAALAAQAKRLDGETLLLLDRLGWRKSRERTLFYTVQYALPVLLMLLVVLWQLLGNHTEMPWIGPLAALGIGYLIPKRLLARAVAARQQQLADEVSTMIPLLRMLFEVGMTVEQALRVLVRDGKHILPQMTRELQWMLQRVDGGMGLSQELRRSAELLDVDAVTDCFAILEQLVGQGGGAMASLLSLKQLLDDRRMTTLQERVSKMSAKMSVVMITFLFPALLIVLAGPGFIAIFKALGAM